jgi:DNA (cytosine-5)-methyltransferase 1
LSLDVNQNEIISKLKGNVDLLIGGPPCQGFSTLGKRRDNCKLCTLVDVYLRTAKKISPKIIIMENVKGILSKKHPEGGTYPDVIKKTLLNSNLGPKYDYLEFLFDTSEYGMAQTRVRYVLIAVKKDENSKILCKAIYNEIKKRKTKKKKLLKDVIGDLPNVVIGEPEDPIKINRKHIYNHVSLNHSEKLQERISYVPPGGGLLDVPEHLLTPHLIRVKKGKYGNGGLIKNIYGRLEWNKQCGTIVAGMDKITCGRFVHPEQNRLLTPRECARIQSYPDSFIFKGSLVTQYYLIGNSVPPRMSRIIADSIRKHLA